MYGTAEKIFYTLSAMVLGAAFFVLQPTPNQDVQAFQTTIQHEFKIAAIQLWGDRPVMNDALIAIGGINQFYQQSADAMISLLTPAPSESDMFAVIRNVYTDFRLAIVTPKSPVGPQVAGVSVSEANSETPVPDNFMQEPAVPNIIPQSVDQPQTVVSSMVLDTRAVNDNGMPWVNLRDNDTGQVYCVAIYNAEVNRYLGPCKNDIH